MQSKFLWELQLIDQDIAKISKEVKQRDLVLSLKDKQIKIDELQVLLDKENYEIAQLEKITKKVEEELKGLEEKKGKHEKQLYGGSCNVPKELEGMREKLNNIEIKINEVEELLLMYLDQVEDKVQIINQNTGQLEVLNKEYRKGVKKYKLTKKELNDDLIVKQEKQASLKKQLTKQLLEKYHAMQKRYNNNAIAKVENNLCSGCRIEIPVIHLKSIRDEDSIKYCEHCGRILTILDD